jgi:stage V sporulation protein K
MEDHKSELILILAGYQNEMESFLQINPGLRSRFPIHIEFPDYQQTELLQIAELMCVKREYRLSAEARNRLVKLLHCQQQNLYEPFGNARTVRNLIEKAIRKQAVRLIGRPSTTRQDLMMIEPVDIQEVR